MTPSNKEAASANDPGQEAARRMAQVRPHWRGLDTAAAFVGLEPDVLLHAGPPLRSPRQPCRPLLNAACAALLFEGRADDVAQARALIGDGEVELLPAQDRQVVTPLAAVVSASMYLHEVVDAADDGLVAYAPLNEGGGPAQRFGILSPAVVERLNYVHRELAPVLVSVLAQAQDGEIDLLAIAARALAEGDELHARGGVGARLLADELARLGLPPQHQHFLETNPHAFLNPWMAACACMMAAARRYAAGKVLIAAGGNGEDFGIQCADRPGHWRAAPADIPHGPALSETLAATPRLPAIGDSAVIDAVGFGALALDAAPAHAERLGGDQAATMQAVADALLTAEHPLLHRRIGLDAARVTPVTLPGVCLAALDAAGEQGIVGTGIARHPARLYHAAVQA